MNETTKGKAGRTATVNQAAASKTVEIPIMGRNGSLLSARGAGRRAFTLIELLVVIAIIALLISILLPALGEVRRQGKIIVCRSNLRQVAMAFNSYGASNKEAIAGSPTTSGWHGLKTGEFNGVSMQIYDWIGPLASDMGYNELFQEYTTDDASRADRFNFYRDQMKPVMCTENNIQAVPWPGAKPPWTAGRVLSYNTSTQFTSTEEGANLGGTGYRFPQIDRRRYTPFIHRAGSLSMKVIAYEGSRYTDGLDTNLVSPDFDFAMIANFGGAFGDTGPWLKGNRSLDRQLAPGEDISEWVQRPFDPRLFAFRHGSSRGTISSTSRTSSQIMGHLAFFDGHVEIKNDIDATNPDYWFPTGTIIGSNNSTLNTWNATKKLFPTKIGGSAGRYKVP